MSISSQSGIVSALDASGQPHRESLIGLGSEALAARLRDLGVPERQLRMRARQIRSWLYARGATSFAAMTDIAKDLRGELEACFSLDRPLIATEQVSVDGTPGGTGGRP